MWAAMALTALTCAPSQNGTLKLTNERITYGVLGQKRDNSKFLPGDVLVVAFDIEGLKVKDDGKVLYAMGMELTKVGGKAPLFKTEPQPLEAVNTLGGTTLPAFALTVIGTDTEKGTYQLKVTVKDRNANKTETLVKSFQVEDKDTLGFVKTRLTSTNGEPAPAVAVPGQRLMLNTSLVGFKTGKDRLPHITFEMQVYDSKGKVTVEKPFKGDIKTEIKDTPGMMNFLPIPLELNRPGKYKVVMKAVCNLSKGKTAVEQTLDLEVLDR